MSSNTHLLRDAFVVHADQLLQSGVRMELQYFGFVRLCNHIEKVDRSTQRTFKYSTQHIASQSPQDITAQQRTLSRTIDREVAQGPGALRCQLLDVMPLLAASPRPSSKLGLS